MNVDELHKLVNNKIKEIQLLQHHHLRVSSHNKVRPDDPPRDAFLIQLSIGSRAPFPFEEANCPFFDFWYNRENNLIEDITIDLKDLNGQGVGAKLVKAIEELGRALGCKMVQTVDNFNPEFWQEMKYEKAGEFWQREL